MPETIFISDTAVRFGAPGPDQFDSDNYYIRAGTGSGDFPFTQGNTCDIQASGCISGICWRVPNWKYDCGTYTQTYTGYGSAISHTTTITTVKIT